RDGDEVAHSVNQLVVSHDELRTFRIEGWRNRTLVSRAVRSGLDARRKTINRKIVEGQHLPAVSLDGHDLHHAERPAVAAQVIAFRIKHVIAAESRVVRE